MSKKIIYMDEFTVYELGELLFHKKSKFQTIDVYRHRKFGNILFIDGDVQIAEYEEEAYSNALTEPILKDGLAKRVAIIGGGDCGVLRQALTFSVDSVTVVDIDEEVVNVSKKFLPKVVGNSLEDKRSKLIIGDAFEFLEKNRDFDAIIYDLTMEPVGIPKNFMEIIAGALKKGGRFSAQCGSAYDEKRKEKINEIMKTHFTNIRFETVWVPAFIEPWIFVYGEKK
ncbi:MAG: methyltransferase domain-containing protein [Candidatus Aenigmatarchaeota archaeon]